MKDCLVLLLRGIAFIEGQGALVDAGYAYAVRNEEWLRLGGNAVVLFIEEGEMKGICTRKTQEAQQIYRAEREAEERRQRRPWNRAIAMFRRGHPEVERVQCNPQ